MMFDFEIEPTYKGKTVSCEIKDWHGKYLFIGDPRQVLNELLTRSSRLENAIYEACERMTLDFESAPAWYILNALADYIGDINHRFYVKLA